MLNHEDYIKVIEKTPLVSIDLIVRDENGLILLGKRINEPARGTLFVPGCRMYKDESIKDCIERVARTELGCDARDLQFCSRHWRPVSFDQCIEQELQVNEHMYPTNFLEKRKVDGDGTTQITTHYIALGVRAEIKRDNFNEYVFAEQHQDWGWFHPKFEIPRHPHVHQLTKRYFK